MVEQLVTGVGLAGTPRVRLVTLGGTASMTSGAAGATPSLEADSLLAAAGDLSAVAEVQAHSLRSLPGASLGFDDLRALLEHAAAACDEGAAGVVVVQGTDTLEESAFFTELLWKRSEPVVFTGAMRHADAAGADGAANLRDALIVAADPTARGRGALVVLDGIVHAARYVRKTATTSLAAFASVDGGPAGRVVEGRTSWHWAAGQRLVFELPEVGWPRVRIVRVGLGDEPALLAAAAGCSDGLVVEAFGGGHLPSWWIDDVRAVAASLPVVLASRTGSGETLRSTYGFPGAEISLIAAGLIPAGRLDGVKARLLVTVGLASGHDRLGLQEDFERFI